MADTHLTIDPSPTSEEIPAWLSEIKEEYKESENNRKPYIPEVPRKLKEKKEECYRPLAVSIGPYHYSDREGKLQQVEKLKFRMMVKFVEDSKAPREDLYVNVKEELQKARGCYDEIITEQFDDEEFIKMMFIDGCFILQFMHCLNNESEKLEMSDRQIFHVKRDLLLLENQLPFAVLDSLRRQRYTDLSESNEIINNFLSLHIRSSRKPFQKWVRIAFISALGLVMIPILFPLCFIISVCICFCLSYRSVRKCFVSFGNSKNVSLDWSPAPGKTQPDHLLQLLYYKSMYHYSKRNHKKAQPGSRGHGLYYSAKKLKKVGILFWPGWTAGAITDVKFKSSLLSGKVEVPPIIIDESTESLLLNYSDRKGKLQQVEKLKARMMVEFVEDSGAPREDFYDKVKEELQKARGCYDEIIKEKFNVEEFSKMMFIDGCFILQFMHCLDNESEKLEMSEQQIFHVKRDLLLLENQLPFAVLHSLREQRYEDLSDSNEIINNFLSLHIRSSGKPMKKWIRIALAALVLVMIPILFPLFLIFLIISLCCLCMFCCLCHQGLLSTLKTFVAQLLNLSLDWSPPPGKTQPDHFLQLLYYKSMYHYSKRNHQKAQPGSRGHGLYYSAKKLKKAGIRFWPRLTGAITDVKFKSSLLSGKVVAPPIIIDESTESLLLNLVAYESVAALDQLWVSSYILFMDSLIDDAEDVEDLRSNGIIINYLGADQKVASLFNGMGESLTDATYDTAAYNDVKMDINKQCESTVKRWAYEWKKSYFSNPWTFITLLAASFGLCLTATQTYYTRFPPK